MELWDKSINHCFDWAGIPFYIQARLAMLAVTIGKERVEMTSEKSFISKSIDLILKKLYPENLSIEFTPNILFIEELTYLNPLQ